MDMKKLLVFIIMPFVAVFFHCNAQEHSLRVADVYVTNQSGNISSQYITGQVSYDPETQTLTMENASITCPDPSGYNVVGPDIESTNMDLTLKLIGENSIQGLEPKDVQPGEAVDVFNPLGQCIYHSQIQSSRTFVPLHKGMYIVRVGKYSKKVLVN